MRFEFLHYATRMLVGLAFAILPLYPADFPHPPQAQLASNYGRLPLAFEANHGQVSSGVKFMAGGAGCDVFLKQQEAVITLTGTSNDQNNAIRMKFIGANPSSRIVGEEELPGKSNYFVGEDPRNWRTNIPTYARVRYRSLYPGVDLVYRGTKSQIEYDLVLAPGSRPSDIRLSIQGVQHLSVDPEGDLIFRTREGIVRQKRPFAYQETGSIKQAISCRYVLKGRHQAGFIVGDYDGSLPLIIDPVINYSTFLGAAGGDAANGIAVDAAGNAYILGGSTVTKLNADGTSVVYRTVIGQASSGGIAVDSSGNAYITGSSYAGFPLVNPIQAYIGGLRCGSLGNSICPDAFVAKLNSTGSALIYSTYLGGTGDDQGRSITVDSSGNAYVTGSTDATDFPTTPGAFQSTSREVGNAFVSKINAAGSAFEYSTYLGGSADSGGSGIAVDSAGNAYVTGSTSATDFPTTPGSFQTKLGGHGPNAFVTKLNAAGSGLVYSTYLGGSGSDLAIAIAVDPLGSACIAGYTFSSNFPTRNSLQSFCGGACTGYSDAFVAKLNAAGTGLFYSTYLGGSGGDYINALALDESGNAYVTGWTFSADFPTVHPIPKAFVGQTGGYENQHAFAAGINAPGSALLFSTYLGGNGQDIGLGIAVDSSDRIYVAGNTSSTDFPTVDPLQPMIGGGNRDAFVTRIVPGPPAVESNAAAVSNGWPIKKYALNNIGAVVFAGGDFQGFADGIVYSWSSEFFKIASLGYEPPGVPGSLFAGFATSDFSDLALNDAGDVAFTARFVSCSSGDLASCLNASPPSSGIFRYSDGRTSRIVLEGDPVPGRAGFVFRSFDRIWLNGSGDIAFKAKIDGPANSAGNGNGLFLYSAGQIKAIATDYDPTPRGADAFDFSAPDISLSFGDNDEIVFCLPAAGGAFRYANGALTQLLAAGDPSPEGGVFRPIYEAACNARGDVVFHASYGSQPSQQGLYLLRADGSLTRILADGESTPAGGSFSLWYENTNRFGGNDPLTVDLSPTLNDDGTVLFVSPIRGGDSAGGLFLYDGEEIQKVVASGDPRPDDPKRQFGFAGYVDQHPVMVIQYALNNAGMAVFNPGHAGLFVAMSGKIAPLEMVGDLTPPIEGSTYALQDIKSFLLNDSGRVAFQSPLCCGVYTEGILLARLRSPAVPNGSFESYGPHYGLPPGWSTSWANSGKAEAFENEGASAAAFDGTATLRLHVEPGGGSVFVLSDAAPAAIFPDMYYRVECRMRFYFDSDSDVAFFSVIQFDNAGNEVGFDEVRGLRGDSYWSWEAKRLLIHTAPNAAYLRYRFGLSSSREKYLDIDAVR